MEAFKEWRSLFDQGKLNATQSRFFNTQKPEELYDISTDPFETNNLAQLPEYLGKLNELRGQLTDKMVSLNDV